MITRVRKRIKDGSDQCLQLPLFATGSQVIVADSKGEWHRGLIEKVPAKLQRKRKATPKAAPPPEPTPPEFSIQTRAGDLKRSLDVDEYGVSWFLVVSKHSCDDCAFGERCVQKDEPIFSFFSGDGDLPPWVSASAKPHVCVKCKNPLHNLCFQNYFQAAISSGRYKHGTFYCPECGTP